MLRERRDLGPSEVVYWRRGSAGSRLVGRRRGRGRRKPALQRARDGSMSRASRRRCRRRRQLRWTRAIERARARGRTVSLDLNVRRRLWAGGGGRTDAGRHRRTLDVVLGSLDEVALVAGLAGTLEAGASADPEAAAGAMLALGPHGVVVKLGADGALAHVRRGEGGLRRRGLRSDRSAWSTRSVPAMPSRPGTSPRLSTVPPQTRPCESRTPAGLTPSRRSGTWRACSLAASSERLLADAAGGPDTPSLTAGCAKLELEAPEARHPSIGQLVEQGVQSGRLDIVERSRRIAQQLGREDAAASEVALRRQQQEVERGRLERQQRKDQVVEVARPARVPGPGARSMASSAGPRSQPGMQPLAPRATWSR